MIVAAAALALVASPIVARAYVLPGDAILASVAKRRQTLGFNSLVLEGHRGTADAPNKEKVWLAIRPGLGYRLEAKSGEQTDVTLVLGKKIWTYMEGGPAGAGERLRADLVRDFLGSTDKDSGGKRGLAFLDAYGIDDEQVHLGRLEGRVAYVIGAKAGDMSKPQLWIDKDLRVPIRLIEVDKASKKITDTRLLGYGSAQTGEWYPRKIEVWRDGQLISRTTLDVAKVNTPVDDGLFKKPTR